MGALFKKNLPWKTILLISLGNLIMEINLFAHTGYLPAVLNYINVSWLDVGFITGLIYFLHASSAALGGITIPYLDSYFGQKKTLVMMLTMTGCSAVFFAFSASVWWVCLGITMKGFFAAGLMSARLISNDMCNEDNQYSISSWNIQVPLALAGMLGPSLTSMMVLLPKQYPKRFGGDAFLKKFPILVPNLAIGGLAFAIAAFSWWFLTDDFAALSEKFRDNVNETTELLQTTNMSAVTVSKENTVSQNNETTTATTATTPSSSASSSETTENASSPLKEWNKISIFNKIKTLICKKDLLLGTIIVTLHEALASGFGTVLPLWLETPAKMNGFGMLPKTLGIYFIIVGCIALFSNSVISPYLNPKMGAKVSFQVWSLFLVVFIALIPVQFMINLAGLLVTHISLIKCFEGAAFLSGILFVQNCMPRESSHAAIVFSFTFSKAVVSIVNLSFGSIFAWSLKNNKSMYANGLGFPFNYGFSFICIGFLHFVCAVIAIFLKDDIDIRQA